MTPAQLIYLFGSSKPLVDIDFTTGKYRLGTQSSSDFLNLPGTSFTRASTGYALNSAGTLVSFGSGVPRITDLGLLIEQAATNIALQSQTLDNASWGKAGSSVSADTAAAPDLTITADSLVEDATTGSHEVNQSATITANSTNTLSVYVHAAGRSQVRLAFSSTYHATARSAIFSLSGAGSVVSNDSGITTTIKPAIAGWYRVSITGTSNTSNTAVSFFIQGAVAGSASYTGNSTAALNLWGAQLEASSFATSYIPTTTAAATRAADAANVTGLTAPSQGALIAYAMLPVATGASQDLASLNDGTTSNRVELRSGSSMSPVALGTASGASIWNIGPSGTITIGVPFHMALSFVAGAQAATFNGAGTVTASSATVPPGMTTLGLGNVAGVNPVNGYIQRVILYPTPNTGLTP